MSPRGSTELSCTGASAFAYVSVLSCPVVFCEALCASASIRGRFSLVFCSVPSYTCASACLELVLVSLYNQWSSVIHMHMDPLCVHCSPVFPPTLPCFYCIYYIIATSALLPICVGAHGGISRIYQSWQQASLRAGWKLLDEWGTKPLFSDAVVNLFKLHQDSWTEIRKMEVVQKDNL